MSTDGIYGTVITVKNIYSFTSVYMNKKHIYNHYMYLVSYKLMFLRGIVYS